MKTLDGLTQNSPFPKRETGAPFQGFVFTNEPKPGRATQIKVNQGESSLIKVKNNGRKPPMYRPFFILHSAFFIPP
jgi:hypothetical protein